VLSAVLFLFALAVTGITINGAILMWTSPAWKTQILVAIRHAPSIAPAALAVTAIWWLVAQVETWIALRTGPISAWFIATFGWADMSWLFTTISYGALWIRWVLAAVFATWLMAALLRGRKHTLSLGRLGLATVWFALLVALPWAYLVPWRPTRLPSLSLEPAFIAVKLLTAAAMMAVGVALIIREASPRTQES